MGTSIGFVALLFGFGLVCIGIWGHRGWLLTSLLERICIYCCWKSSCTGKFPRKKIPRHP